MRASNMHQSSKIHQGAFRAFLASFSKSLFGQTFDDKKTVLRVGSSQWWWCVLSVVFSSILHPPFGRWMWTFSHWPLPSPRISPCCRSRRRTAAPSCKTPAGNILSLSSLQGTFEKKTCFIFFSFDRALGWGWMRSVTRGNYVTQMCVYTVYIYIYMQT